MKKRFNYRIIKINKFKKMFALAASSAVSHGAISGEWRVGKGEI